jgi:hypothetical protein
MGRDRITHSVRLRLLGPTVALSCGIAALIIAILLAKGALAG